MCGIFGIITNTTAVRRTMEGLQKLQYRGYDSAGIAFQSSPTTNTIHRVIGTVSDLAKDISPSMHALDSKLAISHTRWATNGRPTIENAHPIVSDDLNSFVVVHNGIVTNASELRTKLSSNGIELFTQTDTEVVPKLCYLMHERHPMISFHDLVRDVCDQLEGHYAILIISTKYPGKMIVCKNGSPLYIGVHEEKNDIIISSDIAALDELQVYAIDDGVVLEMDCHALGKGFREIENYSPVINAERCEFPKLGDFRCYMEKEIIEQPHTLRASISKHLLPDHTIHFPNIDIDALKTIADARLIVLIGCGTSFHACIACKDIFRTLLSDKLVLADSASSFCEDNIPLSSSDVCIFVSQSGETADTIAALRFARSKAAFCCTITNHPSSTLAVMADVSVDLGVGEEVSVASTKAYTSQLCIIIMFVHFFAHRPTICGERFYELPIALNACMQYLNKDVEELAKYVIDFPHILIIGCSSDLATCMEGALKIKEVSYIHAEAILAGELKHGPLALIDRNVLVIVMATSVEPNKGKISIAIEQLAARDANIVVITNDNSLPITEFDVARVIRVPKLKCKYLQRVVDVVPLQLLALHLAVVKEINIDRPRNLAKAVTVA